MKSGKHSYRLDLRLLTPHVNSAHIPLLFMTKNHIRHCDGAKRLRQSHEGGCHVLFRVVADPKQIAALRSMTKMFIAGLIALAQLAPAIRARRLEEQHSDAR